MEQVRYPTCKILQPTCIDSPLNFEASAVSLANESEQVNDKLCL
jgi:hypothetical protein